MEKANVSINMKTINIYFYLFVKGPMSMHATLRQAGFSISSPITRKQMFVYHYKYCLRFELLVENFIIQRKIHYYV